MSDAEYYQSHKDDSDEWSEPEGLRRRKPARQRLDAIISIRLRPEEESVLKAAAKSRGQTLSAFVRVAALRDAGGSGMSSPFVRMSWTHITNFDAVWKIHNHVLTGTGLTDVRTG
jgi:hypothetical protein